MPPPSSSRGHSLDLVCPSDLLAVRDLARDLRSFLEEHHVPPDHVDSWELLLSEAATNAIRYAPAGIPPQDIQVSARIGTDAVELRVHDHTRGFTLPETFELPPPDAEGGRGLFLMHSLSDSLDYLRGRHGNCLVLRRRIPPRSAPTPTPPPTPAAELEATLQTMTEELAASFESLSAIFRFTEDLARGGVNAVFVERWLLELRSITGADWFVLRIVDADQQMLRAFQTLPPDLQLPPLPLHPPASPGSSVESCATTDQTDIWFDSRHPLAPADPLHALGPGVSGFCHPMSVSGELMGLLTIGFNNETRTFSAGQVSIVQTLSDFLAIQIRDSRYEQARLQARLLDRDFELASGIQRSLLPKEHPTLGPWVTRGFCESAQRVGGDFYDILTLPTGGLLFAVADVMGKGLPAALFATVFRTLLRARPDLASRPGEFLSWLNQQLANDLGELDMFITAQLAFIDLPSRTLRIAGAGHPPLLIAGKDHPASEIPSAGPPLGILDGISFAESCITLPAHARVLMYTDGMSEIFDAQGEQTGITPLRTILDESVRLGLTPDSIRDRLAGLQSELAGEGPAGDDRTVLLLVETPG